MARPNSPAPGSGIGDPPAAEVRGAGRAWFSRAAAVRLAVLIFGALAAYALWNPGVPESHGRFDQGRNALWLAHGWLGGPDWFVRNERPREAYESPAAFHRLAETCRRNGIAYVFPHLCPAEATGALPPLDPAKVAPLAAALPEAMILPWVGGVFQQDCPIDSAAWRDTFVSNCAALLQQHPELDGIHLNIEPLPDGNAGYLLLLADLKRRLPAGRMLSVAAYPPPTRWHPHPEVHWSEAYYAEIARHADQIVPMLYDTSIRVPKAYVSLVRRWTREVLLWGHTREVVLGVPAYEDEGVGYHDPRVENIENALAGVNAGLADLGESRGGFTGIAVYADWTTSDEEWAAFRRQFRAR